MSLHRLKEIDFRHKLFRSGDRTLCLGPTARTWVEFLAQCVGEGGFIAWVEKDTVSGEFPGHVAFYREDIRRCDLSVFKERTSLYDVVTFALSSIPDAASGASITDLQESVFDIIRTYLKRGGTFLSRIRNEE